MLIASETMRALMSMPDAMPARSLDTAPVVVLVTGVLVTPRPTPARDSRAACVSQFGCATALPNFISDEAERRW